MHGIEIGPRGCPWVCGDKGKTARAILIYLTEVQDPQVLALWLATDSMALCFQVCFNHLHLIWREVLSRTVPLYSTQSISAFEEVCPAGAFPQFCTVTDYKANIPQPNLVREWQNFTMCC